MGVVEEVCCVVFVGLNKALVHLGVWPQGQSIWDFMFNTSLLFYVVGHLLSARYSLSLSYTLLPAMRIFMSCM